MELLSETTIGSTLHRISDAWQPLTNLWEPKIASYTPTRFGLPTLHGGYARPKWGSRSFLPDLFADNWEPPVTLQVKDMLTDSDEASAITVFEGTLHLEGYNEVGVDYQSYGAEYTKTETDKTYSGTLLGEFTTACGANKLNLTLDSNMARLPSPSVSYTASGESMLIDNLSKMAAFFCHAFYIEDGTLYLIDLLQDNGISYLDEFGYFRGSVYSAAEPYSLIKAGDYFVDGLYTYGEEFSVATVCHTTQADIEDALDRIKVLLEHDRYRFRVIPEASELPVIGQMIVVTNESLQETTTVWMRVTDISPDITHSEILIEGFGGEFPTSGILFKGPLPNLTGTYCGTDTGVMDDYDASQHFISSGATVISYSISGAPTWVSLDTVTGVISGMPVAFGLDSGITVTGTTADGSEISNVFSISVIYEDYAGLPVDYFDHGGGTANIEAESLDVGCFWLNVPVNDSQFRGMLTATNFATDNTSWTYHRSACITHSGYSDYTWSAPVSWGFSSDTVFSYPSLIVRWIDNDNYIMAGLSHDGFAGFEIGKLYIWVVTDGVASSAASMEHSYAMDNRGTAPTPELLEVICNGTDITVNFGTTSVVDTLSVSVAQGELSTTVGMHVEGNGPFDLSTCAHFFEIAMVE